MNNAGLWTSENVPAQGLGLMRLTNEWWGDADRDPGLLVAAAVESGVTLLDTAEMYRNEEVVGKAVAAHRDQITLCSKFGVYWGPSGRFDDWHVRTDSATVRSAIEGTLRRLDVDTVDLYYLHHRGEDTPIEETVAAMAELRQAGKIGALGLSNVTIEDVRRAHAVHPITAVQQEWSLSDRGVESMLPVLNELGIALVAHSPLGHGSFTQPRESSLSRTLGEVAVDHEVTPSQVALAWVHTCGGRSGQAVIPLPGTTRVAHLLANVAAAEIILSDTDMDRLETAATSQEGGVDV